MPGDDNVLDALLRVQNTQGRAIRFFDLAELDFSDAMPEFITHAQLQAQVIALANAFRDLAGTDAPVVTILEPSTISGLVALLAAEVAGAVHPVNYLMDAAAIADCMNVVGAQIVVTPGPQSKLGTYEKLQQIKDDLPKLRAVISTGRGNAGEYSLRDLVHRYPAARLDGRQPKAGDIAALFHTAGTTGKSKVVPLTHANLLAAANGLADAWRMNSQTRIVNALPFFHVAGANLLSLGPLCRGGEVLLLTETGLRNPAVLAQHWKIVETCRPTIIGGIPSSLVALLDVPLNGADIRSVQFCATGGASMPASAGEAFQRQFNLPVHTIYGMTEMAGLIATAPVGEAPDYNMSGHIVSGVDACIRPLGQDQLTTKPDISGVICVRGRQLFRGYLGQAEGTSDILPGGWLETGDIGTISSGGGVTISGRSKDVIIRAGNNIDPSVIETAANLFPAVSQCAAVAMPDRYAGEVPVLYVVGRSGHSLSIDALMHHLRSRLVDPQTRPAHVFLLEKLPLTPVGKLSRVALRQQATEAALARALKELGVKDGITMEHTVDGELFVHVSISHDSAALRQAISALGLRAEITVTDEGPAPKKAELRP